MWDSALPRFGVRIMPAGSRVYLVQYRAKDAPGEAANTRRITIGQHDGELWNVTKARAKARKFLAPVDLGRDPFAEQVAERVARSDAARVAAEADALRVREAEARRRDSFEAVAEGFIDLCLKDTRSGHETARLLRTGPVKASAGRHIAEVRRADVADLLDHIRKRSTAAARLTYAALRALFGWCVERDLVVASPCDRLRAPPRPEPRDRVLEDQKLRAIWEASESLGYPFGPIVRLLMLTAQRRAEVAGMAWSEIDLEAAAWRIPNRLWPRLQRYLAPAPSSYQLARLRPGPDPRLASGRPIPERFAGFPRRSVVSTNWRQPPGPANHGGSTICAAPPRPGWRH